MAMFSISSSKSYDGSLNLQIDGDPEVVKGADILAIVKEVTRDTDKEAEETEETEGRMDGIEERIGSLDDKIEKLDERLDKMDEKLDRLFKKLDEFEKTDPNRFRDIPTVHSIPGWTYTELWDKAPDEETRKRIWEYWHNPDGTPKFTPGITPEKPEMTMGVANSYFGFNAGEKDTTARMDSDGVGNVSDATEQTSSCGALNPMALKP